MLSVILLNVGFAGVAALTTADDVAVDVKLVRDEGDSESDAAALIFNDFSLPTTKLSL